MFFLTEVKNTELITKPNVAQFMVASSLHNNRQYVSVT